MKRSVMSLFSCELISILISLSFCPSLAMASGFLDFNYYYDTRDFNVFTINIKKDLDEKFQYFSLTNFQNGFDAQKNFEQTNFLTEQNIRYKIGSSLFDAVVQNLIQSGDSNDALRLGARFRVSSLEGLRVFFDDRLTFTVTVFPFQLDSISGFNWQIEYFYFLNIVDNFISIVGFFDHNILEADDQIVTEHQLAFRILGGFHLVTEFRYNTFPGTQETGVGFGVEYKVSL